MRMMMIPAMVQMDLICCFVELHDGVKRQHLAQFARQQLEKFFRIPMARESLARSGSARDNGR